MLRLTINLRSQRLSLVDATLAASLLAVCVLLADFPTSSTDMTQFIKEWVPILFVSDVGEYMDEIFDYRISITINGHFIRECGNGDLKGISGKMPTAGTDSSSLSIRVETAD